MPFRTMFLSRLIGLYSLIVALAMSLHKDAFLRTVAELIHSPALVEIAGVLALAAGLAIVLGHNVWSGGAVPVIVTLVGWFSMLKGLVLLFLPPETLVNLFERAHYDKLFFVSVGVDFVLGAYLTYGGFKAES